ncbi:MAG: sigma-70 family RNA polymerase sigma factor [Thermoguttaceae bacterium]|nr:sigma-70 family RNA polymerase sigma factor [Thermoguttaceae bacterium]
METVPTDYTQDEDTRLMLAVKAGDALAFEELMNRYQGKVLSMLIHFTESRQQAEELTQDIFMNIYKARGRYEPTAKFKTWLYKIVENRGLNFLRSRKRRPERLLNTSPPNDGGGAGGEENLLAQSGYLPARQYDRAEEREMVNLALRSLDPRYREAVLYHHIEGMDYSQIGQIMDLTPSAVKSLLHRARRRLAEILAPYMKEGKRPR